MYFSEDCAFALGHAFHRRKFLLFFFWREETRERKPETKEGGNQGNQKEETRDCSRANVQTLCYQTRSSANHNSVVLTIINYSPCFGVGFSPSRLIKGGSPLCGTI